jgi:hypothetical protein
MRKHLHTSIVILCLLAGVAQGQDSGVFSNYFTTEAMAQWCHSGRVERCQAAGVEVTEPTFWDYILGKNHAKLLNVKTDIKACIPYYCKPTNDVLAVLASDGIAGLVFSNEAHFLTYCGLPTNALDETPYFKSQYPSVTGGWQNVRVMLKNMTATAPVSTWESDQTNSWHSSGFGTNFEHSVSIAMGDWAWSVYDVFYPGYYDGIPRPYRFFFNSRDEPETIGGVYADSVYGSLVYSSITNIQHASDFYLISSKNIGFDYDSNSFFSAQSCSSGMISTNWVNYTNFSEAAISGRAVGVGVLSDYATDPGFPQDQGDIRGSLGWIIAKEFIRLDWSGVNGFKYK